MTVAADIVTLNINYGGLLVMVFLIIMKKYLFPRNIPNISNLECYSHTLFMTKVAEKPYPFRATHTHIAHIREYPQHYLTCAIPKSNIRLGSSLT